MIITGCIIYPLGWNDQQQQQQQIQHICGAYNLEKPFELGKFFLIYDDHQCECIINQF